MQINGNNKKPKKKKFNTMPNGKAQDKHKIPIFRISLLLLCFDFAICFIQYFLYNGSLNLIIKIT